MKYVNRVMLGMLVLSLLAVAKRVEAAASDTCAMSVLVQASLNVDVTDEPVAFGSVSTGGSAVSGSGATVTSAGTGQQDYQLKITGNPSGWTAGSSAGNEQYVLQGLFTSSTSGFVFGSEDVLTTGDQTATDTVFAITGEGVSVKGYDCSYTSVRKLWFQFTAPTSTIYYNTTRYITVTVTAIAG